MVSDELSLFGRESTPERRTEQPEVMSPVWGRNENLMLGQLRLVSQRAVGGKTSINRFG